MTPDTLETSTPIITEFNLASGRVALIKFDPGGNIRDRDVAAIAQSHGLTQVTKEQFDSFIASQNGKLPKRLIPFGVIAEYRIDPDYFEGIIVHDSETGKINAIPNCFRRNGDELNAETDGFLMALK